MATLTCANGTPIYDDMEWLSLYVSLLLYHRGRLKHGRHFTFKSFTGDSAVTLVSEGVEGSLVSADRPLSAHGPWLQVWVDPQHTDKMLADIEETLAKKKNVSYYSIVYLTPLLQLMHC